MTGQHDFHALTIANVRRETADAIVVTFAVPPDRTELFRFKPGQHIALRHIFDAAEVRRNYSICAGPGDALRIAIKRQPGGLFSTWANATLAAGQVLDVMPPAGRFVLPPPGAAQRGIVAFAAGSGITPVLGIVKQALEHERETRVTLVYGNRGLDGILFREELEDLKDRFLGRFELVHVLSRNDEIEAPLLQGRIDAEKVRRLAGGLVDVAGAEHIFLCGPGSMIKEARDALLAFGVERDRVHHEFFAPGGGKYRTGSAPPPAPVQSASPGSEVVAILDGARHRFTVAPGGHVLAAALAAGVKAPYSCTGGMCCTCRARIVEGKADMTTNYSLEPWEIEKGFILTCQAVPTTPRLVVDYDAM